MQPKNTVIMYCMGVTSPRVWLYLGLNKNTVCEHGLWVESCFVTHGTLYGLCPVAVSRTTHAISYCFRNKGQRPSASFIAVCAAPGTSWWEVRPLFLLRLK
jgi:hypothetical protein